MLSLSGSLGPSLLLYFALRLPAVIMPYSDRQSTVHASLSVQCHYQYILFMQERLPESSSESFCWFCWWS